MYEKELTLTVSTQDITSCSICYARNYDTTHPDPLGERVDRLYELRIGGQVMVLCDKCLDHLREKLVQRIDAEEKPEPVEYIDRQKLLENVDSIWDCNDMVFEGDRDRSCHPEDCKGCHWHDTKQYIRKLIERAPAVAVQVKEAKK